MFLFYSLGEPDNILGIMAYLRDVKLIRGHSVLSADTVTKSGKGIRCVDL